MGIEFVEQIRLGRSTTASEADTSKSAPVKKEKQKDLPCPEDADVFKCAYWCDDSSPTGIKWHGTLGGKPCSDWDPLTDEAHMTPTCTCYDEKIEIQQASCVSTCGGKKRKMLEAQQASGSSGNDEL